MANQTNPTTAAFSFSKRFIEPVIKCEPVPAELVTKAEKHIKDKQDVKHINLPQIPWKALERVLNKDGRYSDDPAEAKEAFFEDVTVNTFIEIICKHRNRELREATGTIDLTASARFITMDSLAWTSLFTKLQKKEIDLKAYAEAVWRRLGRQGITNAAEFRNLDTVFLPWCRGQHWTLGLLRPSGKRWGLLNSLSSAEQSAAAERRAGHFTQFVLQHLKSIFGSDYDAKADGWKEMTWPESGEQRNGTDCGAFVCMNAVAVARGKGPYMIRKEKMPGMRQGIAAALVYGSFLEGVFEL